MNLTKLYNELKRRDVFRVATAYIVTSWLVIQVVVSIFPYIGVDDFWITVIFAILAIGFPIALIVGWLYEPTPEGLRKMDEIEVSEEFEEHSERKLNRLIIAVLSTVLIFMVVERVFFASGSIIERDTLAVQTASIAVLPFADMSENQDQEYFSDGLSEELLNVLAKVEGLQVAGRTSSFQYKGQNIDLRIIGEDLGVDHVLEGSIRKFGNQIRITAQLIKAEDGFHVWSETYTREYSANNLFEIQDEISHQVLQELEIRLLPEKDEQLSKDLTSNTEAYDDYLKATQLLVNRKADEIEEAIELFGRAIEKDPEFAAAYARRAIAYDLLFSYGNIDRQDMLDNMRRNIDRALLIDPELGWAYAALGLYNIIDDNYEEANIALEKAHALIPGDPEIMVWYSFVSDWELFQALINRAYETDPYNALVIYMKASMHYQIDEFDEAFELMERNLDVNPNNSLSHSLKAEFMKDQPFGRLDESFFSAYTAYEMEPRNLSYQFELAEISFDLGFFFIVEKILKEVEEIYPNNETYHVLKYEYFIYTEQWDSAGIVIDNAAEYLDIDMYDTDNIETFLSYYHYSNRLDDATDYLETYFPDLVSLDFDNEYYLEDIAYASKLYEKLGEYELAESLAEVACEEAMSYLQYDGDLKKELVQDLMDYMDCMSLRKDKEAFLAVMEEIHFGRGSKANLYTFLDAHPVHDFIKEDRDYRELRDRMEADVTSMRNNAIAWLQEKGDWQSEWKITIPKY